MLPGKKSINYKKVNQNLEMITAYRGYEALIMTYYSKSLEAELLFPQSEWASKSLLMASYSYYLQDYYSEAFSSLDRFLKTYPNDENISYAHYLIAMCFYETIEDEKRDSAPLIKAKNKFNFIVQNYPDSDFALDAKFKLGLIEDILLQKMYLGTYIKKGKWIAAINRFKYVIEKYDTTVFVEEALHRLVEINYKIGLIDESQKYANLLGYNYLSSDWYKKSYKVFNKDYEVKKIKVTKKEKKGVLKRLRKLFD